MPSKFLNYLEQYHDITRKQKKAINDDDIDLLNELIQVKSNIIEHMKRLITPKLMNNDSIKQKVNEAIARDCEAMAKLKQAKIELNKTINKSKKRQIALKGYSKNMK